MEREMRRCRDHLASIGTGIILFGIWSALKLDMEFYFQREEIFDSVNEYSTGVVLVAILIICFVLDLFILLWNLYIGLSARSEALKGKNRWFYLVLSGITLLSYFLTLFNEIIRFQELFDSLLTGVMTVMMDLTMIFTLIELEYVSVRTKRLRRKLAEQG